MHLTLEIKSLSDELFYLTKIGSINSKIFINSFTKTTKNHHMINCIVYDYMKEIQTNIHLYSLHYFSLMKWMLLYIQTIILNHSMRINDRKLYFVYYYSFWAWEKSREGSLTTLYCEIFQVFLEEKDETTERDLLQNINSVRQVLLLDNFIRMKWNHPYCISL